jgi:hypothetical protein
LREGAACERGRHSAIAPADTRPYPRRRSPRYGPSAASVQHPDATHPDARPRKAPCVAEGVAKTDGEGAAKHDCQLPAANSRRALHGRPARLGSRVLGRLLGRADLQAP